MKNFLDRHRIELLFVFGNWVFGKLKPYRQLSVRLKRGHKLGRRYFGPFKVIKYIGEVAYRLEFPVMANIQYVFYISFLKYYLGELIQQVTSLQLPNCLNKTNMDEFTHEDKVDF